MKLTDALQNLLERSRELESRRQELSDCATPSYWIQRETDRLRDAEDPFMEALGEYVDSRLDAKR